MFERFLRFFVENSRMNYTLFLLVFLAGIWSYTKMPKEVFPTFDMDMVSISGNYTGASVDILDKMAVTKIEDNVKSINGITDMTTVISPGKFTIVLEFKKGMNRYSFLNKVKDSVTLTLGNLPSDMDEPTVVLVDRNRDLVTLALTSKTKSVDEMKLFAEPLKSKLFNINGISEVNIFGDSDIFYEVIFDDQKIEAYGINRNELFDKLTTLSYIFPVGKIEDSKKHYYISTFNGAKTAEQLGNTLVKLGEKTFYLSDFTYIKKKYEDATTLYSFNGQSSISLAIKQSETANAIELAKSVQKLINVVKQDEITISISDDNSERIVDRLDVVSSNIVFGIILISILVALLINGRMSFIIFLGIPTSFVIAAVYMHLLGYSINMISLVGVLIAIGIVVDDAIVVSENIQQHLEEGMEPKEAAIAGAKEMVEPVTIASITTLFSFLPILMISGTMGEVMKLIPIALSALVVASLIESFVFLPIHAAHTLKTNAKVTSWEKINTIYNKSIHFFMNWKKTFLILFIILVPLATVMMIKNSKFQMFPKFDATDVKISIKGNENATLEETFETLKKLEQEFLTRKDDFFIKSIDSIAGYRKDTGGNTERNSYVMYMTVELSKLKADNFVDKYITPNLSFYYEEKSRTRTLKSTQVAKKLEKFIEKKNLKEKYNLTEINVLEKKVGPIKTDIQIGLITHNNQLVIDSMNTLEKTLKKIQGVKAVQNSIKYGIDEIKLEINSYGQQLGLTESFIGNYLSNSYLSKKKGTTFDEKEMVEIKIKSLFKDNFEALKNTKIPVGEQFVLLQDVAIFHIEKSFEQIIKDRGDKNFYIYANVDPKIITASEVLEQIEPVLKEIENNGVTIKLKGEAEKNKSLKNDMIAASILALLLIMLSLLYLFNSFRETAILMSVIPFSFLGVLVGHQVMGLNLSMPSLIGGLGLAGVVINDGIIMMTYLKKAKNIEQVFYRATKRFRPIILTTITTLIGMSTLIFFATGEAVIFQPIAIALGFGLAWGTVLNLVYLPVLYTFSRKLK